MPINFTTGAQPETELSAGGETETRPDLCLSLIKSDLSVMSGSLFLAIISGQVAITGIAVSFMEPIATAFSAVAAAALIWLLWVHYSRRKTILKSYQKLSARAIEAERQRSILMDIEKRRRAWAEGSGRGAGKTRAQSPSAFIRRTIPHEGTVQ